jgi:hypothetical protein
MKNETLIGAIQKLPNEQLDQLVYVIDGIKISRKLKDKLDEAVEGFKNPELITKKDDAPVIIEVINGRSEFIKALEKLFSGNVSDVSKEPEKAEPEKAEPEKAEPEKAEPEKAEPEKAEPEKAEPEPEELTVAAN